MTKWGPSTEIQFLKGVGPRYAEVLKKKGIFTFKDLIEFYPRSYQDLSQNKKISELEEGENIATKLKMVRLKSQRISKYKEIKSLILTDGRDTLEAKFFKSPYRGYFNQFEAGATLRVSGKVSLYKNQVQLVHPDIVALKEDSSALEASDSSTDSSAGQKKVQSIYSESESLTQKKIKTLVDQAFKLIETELDPESPWLFKLVPPFLREKYKLPPKWESIKKLHYPDSQDSLKNYIQQKTRYHLSLIFEEFFELELLTAIRRQGYQKEKSFNISDLSGLDLFTKSLPFELTADQQSCLQDIVQDFKKSHPMHRLVQGDVGSGKTLVAFAAAYLAIKNGHQVALMAPTEILAQQHLQNAEKFLVPLGVESVCITGKLSKKERGQLEEEILNGNKDFIIGTHALFEKSVSFKNLALVIVDEQHRFGVHQRQKLKNKGTQKENQSPHFLVMTATPIPRTLTMTLYGDLDVSLIKQLPPGRSPIFTKKFFQKEKTIILEKVLEEIKKGRQAYFVFPLVSESESLDLKSAEYEFEQLLDYFSPFEVGLLHGKMKSQEKEETMEKFRQNKIQILVSTTVIEVGVDVPNATTMVIENCERFGLSQLHQLRGRVGRGKEKGQCFLVLGNKFSQESLFRAKVMEQSTDGFVIAEEDLKLRGPGEILGVKQSGLPTFKLANLMTHQKVLIEARKSAFEWIENPASKNHIKEIKKKYADRLKLSRIS